MAKQNTNDYTKLNLDQIGQRVYQDNQDALRIISVEPLTIGGDAEFNIQLTPPTDFRVTTLIVTNTPQNITFAGFDIVSISIRALDTNNGNVRVGKSSDINTNFYLLDPSGVFSQNVQASASPVAVVFDTGTTSAMVTIVASGNPI
jgi:hypothetical protein